MKKSKPFKFKQFEVNQKWATMKVGTDGVLLGAWTQVDNRSLALDIGTGTGLIAIMMAQRNPRLNVVGLEPDEPCSDEALMNFAASPFKDRLQLINSTIQEFQNITKTRYDLIVSNPPFFLSGTRSISDKRNNARHTDLLDFDTLLSAVQLLLKEKGLFSLILPPEEAELFKKKALFVGLHLNRLTEVYPKANKSVERVLMEFSSDPSIHIERSKLVINKETGRNNWTPDYIALTRDFYTII